MKRADIGSELHEVSQHALLTDEYLELIGPENAKEWLGKRTTTLTPRPLRVPVGFVKLVVDAYRSFQISLGKAAEYLMVDESEFVQRFGDIYAGVEE